MKFFLVFIFSLFTWVGASVTELSAQYRIDTRVYNGGDSHLNPMPYSRNSGRLNERLNPYALAPQRSSGSIYDRYPFGLGGIAFDHRFDTLRLPGAYSPTAQFLGRNPRFDDPRETIGWKLEQERLRQQASMPPMQADRDCYASEIRKLRNEVEYRQRSPYDLTPRPLSDGRISNPSLSPAPLSQNGMQTGAKILSKKIEVPATRELKTSAIRNNEPLPVGQIVRVNPLTGTFSVAPYEVVNDRELRTRIQMLRAQLARDPSATVEEKAELEKIQMSFELSRDQSISRLTPLKDSTQKSR